MGMSAMAASFRCCQPKARKHEPDEIAQQAQRARAQVIAARDLAAIDRLAPERPQGKLPNNKTRPRPRQANEGDGHDHPRQPPAQRHGQTAQNEPEKIEQEAQHGVFVFQKVGREQAGRPTPQDRQPGWRRPVEYRQRQARRMQVSAQESRRAAVSRRFHPFFALLSIA